jgi:membrane associated rhomboid family serine protease
MYAFPKITKAIKVILIVHAVGFLLSIFAGDFVVTNFALIDTGGAFSFISFIWKIFTYTFVGSSNIIGLLFFALFMWWVGSRLEEAWGTKLFVAFYLTVIGVSGLLTYLIVSATGIYILGLPIPIVYGTVGFTFSIIAIYAYIAPNLQFYIFGIFPVKVKWLLLVSIILTLFSGNPTHILYSLILQIITALVAVIFVFITQPLPTWIMPYAKGLKNWVESKKDSFKSRKENRNFKVYTNENFSKEDAIDVEEEKNMTNEEAVKEEVDRILDKISKYGIDTLTKKEKEFLDKAGKQNFR